jgi:hypothetical protein
MILPPYDSPCRRLSRRLCQMEAPASDAPNNLPWARYWAPADQAPLLDDGFLIPPGQTRHGAPRQTAGVTLLADLQNVPCLVLLGSSGLGKSRY